MSNENKVIVSNINDIKTYQLLDYKILYQILLNYKITVFGIFSFISIISLYLAFNLTKIWRGTFQIVLSNESEIVDKNLLKLAPIKNSIDSQFTTSKLETQVEILRSPSVLMPFFKKAKSNMEDKGIDTEFFDFDTWRNGNVRVDLLDGTSVLRMSYQSKYKEEIIPILKGISKAYQDYSGKKNLLDIKKDIAFLNEQISEFEEKTLDSLKKAQDFATKNNLRLINSAVNSEEDSFDGDTIQKINVVINKSKALKEIDEINIKIDALKKIEDDPNKIIEFGAMLPSLFQDKLILKLKNIQIELAESKVKFKKGDLKTISLEKERDELIALLKERAKNTLETQREMALSIKKANERPEDIVITYKSLIDKYARNQFTLSSLQNQFTESLLLEAKDKNPWDLITKPTLRNVPVSPRKKRIVGFGFLTSLLISFIYILLKEEKKGSIYTKEFYKQKFKKPILLNLYWKDKHKWQNKFDLLLSGGNLSKENKKSKVRFVKVGKISEDRFSFLKEILKKQSNYAIEFNDKLDSVVNENLEIILLAQLGLITKIELDNLILECNLQPNSIIGSVIFENG